MQRQKTGTPWYFPMFAAPDRFSIKVLDLLPPALNKIMPLSRAHRADLPAAVAELSSMLTVERGSLSRSYWSSPRLVSAYLRYFLPWNLLRLTRLLARLDLPVPASSPEAPALAVDLGSGPLTLPLALWMARPDWRALPLDFYCFDTVPHPMDLGHALLKTIVELCGDNEKLVWKIHPVRASMLRALRDLPRRPNLLLAGNVLNEVKDKAADAGEQIEELAVQTGLLLDRKGTALFVEPGNRLGGTVLAHLRAAAMEEGLAPVAPCPHPDACPMLGHGKRRWCHFVCEAAAPGWLSSLATQAGLTKDSLTLSFLQLRHSAETEAVQPGCSTGPLTNASIPKNVLPARVVSNAFPVPGMGMARYACSKAGFAIIPAAADIPSGALVLCKMPEAPFTDEKTGAVGLQWEPLPKIC